MNDVTRYTPGHVITSPSSHTTTAAHRYVPPRTQARPVEQAAAPAVAGWSEADQEALDGFDKILRVNVADYETRQAVLDAAKFWYQDLLKATARSDKQDITQCLANLKSKWGSSFSPNMKLLDNLMSDLPEEVAVAFYEARDDDGTLLLNNPAVASFLVLAKRAIDQPAAKSQSIDQAETELEQIEALMRQSLRSEYWIGPKAAKWQARHLELLERLENSR